VARAINRQQGSWYPEDTATFGLLVHHLRTGAPPAIGAVEALLTRVWAGQQVPGYRISGTRSFWYTHLAEINWQRFPMDQPRLLGQFDAYLDLKFAARQNRLNHTLAGIVGSEEAWRRTMSSIQSRDTRIRTREQAAQAEHDAWRTIIDTESTIQAARAAIGR
jgi:hypothetical protein